MGFFLRAAGEKIEHFGISNETPLFVPDVQQSGFLTSIPLIHVILHLPALRPMKELCANSPPQAIFISNLCNSVQLCNF